MRVTLFHFALGFAGLVTGVGASAQQTAASLAAAVDAHYNHLKSLECRYTQTYDGMGLHRVETGTLLLRKPGRMRWTYDTPHGKLFVLDGKFAYSYIPGDTQATRLPIRQLSDLRSPLAFLLGHTELAKELDGLTLMPGSQTIHGAGLSTLGGTPHRPLGNIVMVSLAVDAQGTIHGIKADERDGTSTMFTFENIRDNAPVSDSDFTFTPPAGVAIVTGPPPV